MSTLQTTNLKHPDSASNQVTFAAGGDIQTTGRFLLGATSTGAASTFYDDLIINNTVSGTGAGITFFANATNGFSAIDFADTDSIGRGRITYGHDVDRLMVDVGGVEAIRIDSSGRLLLNGGSDVRMELGTNGTTATNDRNHLRADGDNLKYNTCENGQHIFEQNGFEAMLIDTSGNVAIGKSSPTQKLDVNGTIEANDLTINGSSFRNIPKNSKTAAYTLLVSDLGKVVCITTGGVTIPSGVFSSGDAVTIYNDSGSNQTITQGSSVTLRIAGASTAGNKTLAGYGLCTVLCVASNVFVVGGAGLS